MVMLRTSTYSNAKPRNGLASWEYADLSRLLAKETNVFGVGSSLDAFALVVRTYEQLPLLTGIYNYRLLVFSSLLHPYICQVVLDREYNSRGDGSELLQMYHRHRIFSSRRNPQQTREKFDYATMNLGLIDREHNAAISLPGHKPS